MLTEWNVTLKVDDCGFFIYWKGKDTEGDVLELSQVNDIRPGKYPNVRRLPIFFLCSIHQNNIRKELSICRANFMTIFRMFTVCQSYENDMTVSKVCQKEV